MKTKRRRAEGMPLRLNGGRFVIGDDGALDVRTIMGVSAMKGGGARPLADARKAATHTGGQALPRSWRGGVASA